MWRLSLPPHLSPEDGGWPQDKSAGGFGPQGRMQNMLDPLCFKIQMYVFLLDFRQEIRGRYMRYIGPGQVLGQPPIIQPTDDSGGKAGIMKSPCSRSDVTTGVTKVLFSPRCGEEIVTWTTTKPAHHNKHKRGGGKSCENSSGSQIWGVDTGLPSSAEACFQGRGVGHRHVLSGGTEASSWTEGRALGGPRQRLLTPTEAWVAEEKRGIPCGWLGEHIWLSLFGSELVRKGGGKMGEAGLSCSGPDPSGRLLWRLRPEFCVIDGLAAAFSIQSLGVSRCLWWFHSLYKGET